MVVSPESGKRMCVGEKENHTMRRGLYVFLLLVASCSVALADTVFLRNGSTVRGTVLGFINGRFVVRVTDGGEIRYYAPREVERIEIEGRSLDEARFETRSVEVNLAPNWNDTGVDVRRGQNVSVSATGTIVVGRSRLTPNGLRGVTDPTAPLPSAPEGLLIGAISNDPNAPIVEIGQARVFAADRDGRLYLTVNRGSFNDARGSYTARVRAERALLVPVNPRNRSNRNTQTSPTEGEDDLFGDPHPRRSTEPAATRPRTPSGRSSTSSANSVRELTVEVAGNSRGTETGVELRRGDRVTIMASGSVVTGRRAGMVSPDGGRVGFGSIVGTYPLPNAGTGALIGTIRTTDGQLQGPFLVGKNLTFESPVDGSLILFVNDDNYDDNSGSFNAVVRY